MKKNVIIILLTISVFLLSVVCSYASPILNDFDCIAYYDQEYKIGVSYLEEEIFSDAEFVVSEITSGEIYDKVEDEFDGDIKVYDVRVIKDGKVLNIPFGSHASISVYDGGILSIFTTADIYHVDNDGNIIDLIEYRYEDQSFNMAEISSFGLFVVTDSPLKDESVLFVPTPTPTAYYTPGPTEVPTTTLRPIKLGDLNIDDSIDAEDALCVLKHVARLSVLSEGIKPYGDVNNDQVVDTLDALDILKKVAELSID